MGDYPWYDPQGADKLRSGEASPQIAAKTTAETPAGGPGLFALESAAVEDGGWVKVALDATSADIALGGGDGTLGTLDLNHIYDPDAGWSRIKALATMPATDPAAPSAIAGFSGIAGNNTDAPSASIFAQMEDNFGSGVLGTVDKTHGAQLFVQGSDVQSIPLLEVWTFDGSRAALRIAADGSVLLASPNGNYHKLVVADDGTLSTEAV